MIREILYKLTARMPCRIIGVNGSPYLERYYVGEIFGLTCYLHRFINGDGDREVHDHPWRWSVSMILAGGYLEERVTQLATDGWTCKTRNMFSGRWNFITHKTFHRITHPKPETWTLFFHTQRIKRWGFLQLIETDDCNETGLLYHQPFDISGSANWQHHVSTGRNTERTPLYGGVKDAA